MSRAITNYKSQGYLATVTRDLDEARKALAERTNALIQAQGKLERERSKRPPEPPRGQLIGQPMAEALWEQNRAFREAEEAVREVANNVRELETAVRKLADIVDAPNRMKATHAAFRRIAARRRELRAEVDRNAKLQRTLEGRIANAKATADAARRTAAVRMIESGGDGLSVPESLIRASAEIQIAEAALVDAIAKGAILTDELRTLPAELQQKRHEYNYWRSAVADIDLREAVLPLIPVLARAQVARRAVYPAHDVHKVEISVARDAISAAEEAFASELAD